MATLIAAYNSNGCIGRCDAKCYEAKGLDCDCICGGMNHGVGRRKAEDNTHELAEEWMRQWQEEHSDVTYFEVFDIPAAQLPLF